MELVPHTEGRLQVKSALANHDSTRRQLDDLITVLKRERKAVSHLRKDALETLKTWGNPQDDYSHEARQTRTRMEIWESTYKLA